MAKSGMINVRVESDTKARAVEVLDAIGLSLSDAINILLKRVAAERAFPIALKVPNAVTLNAMAETDEVIRRRKARFNNADEVAASLG